MVQLIKDTSANTPPRLAVVQPAGTSTSGETESGQLRVLVATNRDEVAALAARLRPHELRWLTEDILNAAIVACNTKRTEDLREVLVSWLATAEVLISTRRRLRHILRSRQEMRDRIGRSGIYGRTA